MHFNKTGLKLTFIKKDYTVSLFYKVVVTGDVVVSGETLNCGKKLIRFLSCNIRNQEIRLQ